MQDKSELTGGKFYGKQYSMFAMQEKMNYIKREKLQLGQTGRLLGDLPNLIAGAMEVDIYTCPKCRRIEFLLADSEDSKDEGVPQKQCPKCGKRHDFDYPKCPFCKYDYNA